MTKNSYLLFARILLYMVFIFLFGFSLKAYSQEDTTKTGEDGINVSADLVSSYVWRGVCLDLSPNIQPTFSYTKGNFEVGFWGSVNIFGTYSETDIYLSYSYKNLTFTFFDYFTGNEKYFKYDNNNTSHVFEVLAEFTPEKIPLKITGGSWVYGDDKKMIINSISGDTTFANQYSSYVELAYMFSSNQIDLELSIGGTPIEGFYGNKAGINNITLSVEKKISINSKYNLPIKAAVVANLQEEKIFMVLGIKI